MASRSAARDRPRSTETEHRPATGEERAADETPPTDGNIALRVADLSKTFGSGEDAVTAVDGVSFSVERGEVVGLLGPNGAGKTTTIKSALGLVVPDSGTVEICGVDVSTDPRTAYGHVEAMMEGARNQYWRLTVRENLEYFTAISGEDPATVRDRHDRLLAAFGLQEVADAQVRTLSRGMKQKSSIASTLARDVDVAFLDEPTLGLDVESADELRRQIRDIAAERDVAILLSSHDMDTVEEICDRVVIVDDGEVVVDDTVEALLGVFETQRYRLTVRGVESSTVADLDVAVESVTELDGRVRFDVTADSDAVYRLMRELDSRDVRLETVETAVPDLETAFRSVTGDDRTGASDDVGRAVARDAPLGTGDERAVTGDGRPGTGDERVTTGGDGA
jgi:ABC-2 type transport system ATP-binding protein